MKKIIKGFFDTLAKPHLVEFDYRDIVGMHHGRCYVRCLFGGQRKIKCMMNSFGYTNIRIT